MQSTDFHGFKILCNRPPLQRPGVQVPMGAPLFQRLTDFLNRTRFSLGRATPTSAKNRPRAIVIGLPSTGKG